MRYIIVKVNLKETQKTKLAHAKKNNESVTLQFEKNQISNTSTGEPLYLTQTQINKLNKATTSARITFSKTQMRAQTGGFLGAIIPFIMRALPTIGKTLGSLALHGAAGAISSAASEGVKKKMRGNGLSRHILKNKLELIKAIDSAASEVVRKKMRGNGLSLHIPKNELELIIKATNKLEQSDIIPAGTTEMIENNIGKQDGGFIGTLIATLASILLPSLLGGKGLVRAGHRGDGLTRAGQKKSS
jgi:hypothetical protein